MDNLSLNLAGLRFYLVMNNNGKFFRNYRDRSSVWEADCTKAKLFTKLRTARLAVTKLHKMIGLSPIPSIVVIEAGKYTVLNEDDRVQKFMEKTKNRIKKQEVLYQQERIASAIKQYEEAKKLLKEIKGDSTCQ